MKVTSEGTIIPLHEGRNNRDWKLQVSLGFDPVAKRYRKKCRTVHNMTKQEARDALHAFVAELKNQSTLDADSLTVSRYAETWLKEREEAAQPVRQGTLRNNRVAARTVAKHFGSMLLKDVGPQQVADFYRGLKDGTASLSGRPLSGTSASKIATEFQMMLAKAVRRGLIPSNPCDRLEKEDKPRPDTKERETLSDADLARLVRCLYDGQPDSHRTGALLCLECGLRREEMLALSWRNIDLRRGVVRVDAAYTQDELSLTATKSRAGNRSIPIAGTPLQARLKQWRKVQQVHLFKLGIAQEPSTPVITSTAGGRIHPVNYSRWWRSYCPQIGIRQVGLHALRHSFASGLARQGVDLKSLQALLGDSTGRIALNVYMHAHPDNEQAAMLALASLLHDGPEERPEGLPGDVA